MPKVSVIIPTCDRPRQLKRAIASVLTQTYRDYEIIVVQNGPVEHSQALVRQFIRRGAPIRYFRLRKAHPVNARNFGLRASQSPYVAFLDDDDEWLPNKLEVQLEAFARRPSLGLVACALKMPGKRRKSPDHHGTISLRKLITDGCVIGSLSCVLIRRVCLERVGYFDNRFRIANDYDLYLRLVERFTLYMMGDRLVRYHRHETNLTRNAGQTNTELADVLEKLYTSGHPLKGFSRRSLKSVIEQRRNTWLIASMDPKNWILW